MTSRLGLTQHPATARCPAEASSADRRVRRIPATSNDVLTALGPIWQTTPETARRLKQRIKLVFDYAKAKEFRTGDNPTEGLTQVLAKHRGERRHHAALPYQAVPAFLVSLRASAPGELVKFAFELLILTTTRTSEVLGARWEEVDLEAKTWTIPGARMKAGREHRVPLSPRAVEIFTQAQTYADGSPFVPRPQAGEVAVDGGLSTSAASFEARRHHDTRVQKLVP